MFAYNQSLIIAFKCVIWLNSQEKAMWLLHSLGYVAKTIGKHIYIYIYIFFFFINCECLVLILKLKEVFIIESFCGPPFPACLPCLI